MNVDTELDAWRRQWQSDLTAPVELRRKVERQSRFMRIALAGDVLVTITMGGATAAWAIRSGRADVLLLAVETWIAIAVAWAFGLMLNRGKWSPSARDAAAYIDLSVRRCRARLAGTWFAAVFFIVHTAFVLGWVYRSSPEPRMPLPAWLLSIPVDVVWLCTVLFFGFLVWYRRKKKAELGWFLGLREQASGGRAEKEWIRKEQL